MTRPIIYVGIPTYDRKMDCNVWQALQYAKRHDDFDIFWEQRPSSLLPQSFNWLWCEARKYGCQYFAMIHADICPLDHGWLSFLLQELTKHDADVCSAAVAIKDDRKVCSMGWHPKGVPFSMKSFEYIALADLAELPRTFDAAAVGRASDYLCVNTGLWLADLRKPWVKDFAFQIKSGIGHTEEGTPYPWVIPEDWQMSMDIADAGGRVCATKAIRVLHAGRKDYPNYVEEKPPAA